MARAAPSARSAQLSCSEGQRKCVCSPGYSGDRCQQVQSVCSAVDCSGHGVCLEATGQCECCGGWSGRLCAAPPVASNCYDGIQNGVESGVDCILGGVVDLRPARDRCYLPCESNRFAVSEWGECSAPCGGGVQARQVKCLNANNKEVDASFCSNLHPASSERACNVQTCATFSWKALPYAPCDRSCGGGAQTRELVCLSSVGMVQVDESLCANASTSRPPDLETATNYLVQLLGPSGARPLGVHAAISAEGVQRHALSLAAAPAALRATNCQILLFATLSPAQPPATTTHATGTTARLSATAVMAWLMSSSDLCSVVRAPALMEESWTPPCAVAQVLRSPQLTFQGATHSGARVCIGWPIPLAGVCASVGCKPAASTVTTLTARTLRLETA